MASKEEPLKALWEKWTFKTADFLRRKGLMKKTASIQPTIQILVSVLYGRKRAVEETELFIARCALAMLSVALGSVLLWVLTGFDHVTLLPGSFLLLGMPLFMYRQVEQRVKQKKRALLMELPIFLNQLTLLLNAGAQIQQAMGRISSQQTDNNHPLYDALQKAVLKINAGQSFSQVMDEFSQDCATYEVSVFVNTLLQQQRRGGGELAAALKGYAYQLWDSRKQTAKSMGEEASSKLVFPMVCIFMIVIAVVSAPVIIWMK